MPERCLYNIEHFLRLAAHDMTCSPIDCILQVAGESLESCISPRSDCVPSALCPLAPRPCM